jgi:hypothetical protein
MTANPKDGSGVASGDRRDELHYEPDPDQLVKIRATFKPDDPLPPQEHSAASEAGVPGAGPPIQDVAVVADGPSVWDARPSEAGDDKNPASDDDSRIGARAAF